MNYICIIYEIARNISLRFASEVLLLSKRWFMVFGDFLVQLQKKMGCKSIAELFYILGGEDVLSMSLRNFNLLAANKQKPSFAAFESVFQNLGQEDYKNALTAFIESNTKRDSIVLDFVKNHIDEIAGKVKDSFWKNKENVVTQTWNKNQLTYLFSNSAALRIYYKLIFYKKIKLSDLDRKKEIVSDLLTLNLAIKNDLFIECSPCYYKLPSYELDAPESVRLSNLFIKSILEAFVSLEGSDTQSITHVAALLSRENSKKIRAEMLKIKTLMLEYAEKDIETDQASTVPFIMMGFAKELSSRDLK